VLPAKTRSTLDFISWQQMFSFGGRQYPFVPSMSLGREVEEPDPSFAGYVRGAYKSNGVVFSCMAARLLLFSEARFQFQQLRNGKRGDLFGTEALEPLERPWPGGTTRDLLTRAITDADLAGNFYANRRGDRIYRMRPDWVTIVLGSQLEPDDPGLALDAEVIGYIYHPGGYHGSADFATLLPDSVAHWAPIPDPEARFRGMSWLTPVIREVMSDQAATNHSLQYFEKGATQNYAVVLDPNILADAFEDWVDKFEESHPDFVNAYRTIYLGGGANIVPVGSDMKEADFKQTRGSGETRICMAARVPPIIAGSSEGLDSATYSNYGQARRAFADLTMRPLWGGFSETIAALIDVPSSSQLWYDETGISFLQEDVKDAADILETQARSMRTLSDGGWDPDAIVDAVTSGDLKRLSGQHSGLLPVQMQPPGQQQLEASNGNGSRTPIGAADGQRAEVVEHVGELADRDS
jgi:phage portal protein BeeE